MIEIKLWHRASVVGLISILSIAHLLANAGDASLLSKPKIYSSTDGVRAVFNHAMTSGFNIIGFQPENRTAVTMSSRETWYSSSAFLLKTYAFLRKIQNDPACKDIQIVKVQPHIPTIHAGGKRGLQRFADLTITREGIKRIDWKLEFPNLSRFHQELETHAELEFGQGTRP